MPSKLNPYISFQNSARDAMKFYESVFGGELKMTTFGESGHIPKGSGADGIMHAVLIASNGLTIMASDTPEEMEYKAGRNVSLSLSGENGAELKGYWEKLSDGAKIELPLAKAPWGDEFGMLTDKFGIHWMVNVTAKK